MNEYLIFDSDSDININIRTEKFSGFVHHSEKLTILNQTNALAFQ